MKTKNRITRGHSGQENWSMSWWKEHKLGKAQSPVVLGIPEWQEIIYEYRHALMVLPKPYTLICKSIAVVGTHKPELKLDLNCCFSFYFLLLLLPPPPPPRHRGDPFSSRLLNKFPILNHNSWEEVNTKWCLS